jgi:hypothetical protein
MRALTLDLPPDGSTRTLEHTRHFTSEALLPNVICSFLHFGQRTFMNLLVDSFISAIDVTFAPENAYGLKSFCYKRS